MSVGRPGASAQKSPPTRSASSATWASASRPAPVTTATFGSDRPVAVSGATTTAGMRYLRRRTRRTGDRGRRPGIAGEPSWSRCAYGARDRARRAGPFVPVHVARPGDIARAAGRRSLRARLRREQDPRHGRRTSPFLPRAVPEPFGSEEDPMADRPNLFTVCGGGLTVDLSLSTIDGRPRLTYQDPARTLEFSGEELALEETGLGTVVTVVLETVPDLGTTSFSLLVPPVNLANGTYAGVVTFGVTAVSRTTLAGPVSGQSTTYQVTHLQGTART